MAQHSTPIPSPLPTDGANRPLLSALSQWWVATPAPQASDAELGYESALPWTLDAGGDAGTPY